MTAHSALTRELIDAGLKRPHAALTEPQILLERIDEAMRPGTPVAFRRRVLAEASTFIRAHHLSRGQAA